MRALRRVLAGAAVVVFLVFLGAYLHVRGAFVSGREPAELDALLAPYDEVYRPDGPGPFPTLILFHGCGGLRASLRDWAEFVRERGVLGVLVDSHAGRGLDWEEVCSGRRLLGAERAGDVWVSLERVRAMPDVDPDRVALAGWSHGAWSLMELFARREGERPPSLAAAPGRTFADVAGLVLFYPYCGFAARAVRGWPHATPTLMLLAGQDSIVSPEACASWGAARAAEGRPVESHVYPGVDHGFDQRIAAPGWKPPYDARAGEDARRRVAHFLAERLQ